MPADNIARLNILNKKNYKTVLEDKEVLQISILNHILLHKDSRQQYHQTVTKKYIYELHIIYYLSHIPS